MNDANSNKSGSANLEDWKDMMQNDEQATETLAHIRSIKGIEFPTTAWCGTTINRDPRVTYSSS